MEDEESLARALADGLKAEGFEADLAHDGTDGFFKAQEGRYDVILLDVMLPRMSGFQVCTRLREEGVHTPILMLTARDGEDSERRGLDLGADEYTTGRPHPMIEPAMRAEALEQALADAEVSVVLLDVVLGTGSHPDPATEVTRAIASAPASRPAVVASVCGTDLDPQNASAQRRALERAGVFVAESNADAVEAALSLTAK